MHDRAAPLSHILLFLHFITVALLIGDSNDINSMHPSQHSIHPPLIAHPSSECSPCSKKFQGLLTLDI